MKKLIVSLAIFLSGCSALSLESQMWNQLAGGGARYATRNWDSGEQMNVFASSTQLKFNFDHKWTVYDYHTKSQVVINGEINSIFCGANIMGGFCVLDNPKLIEALKNGKDLSILMNDGFTYQIKASNFNKMNLQKNSIVKGMN
ncbi:MAG: hypothetical protein ACRC9Y_09495 [Aeromonas veronii]